MNQKEATDLTPALPITGLPPVEGPTAASEFDKWLEHFYKECGREVTLAYTTLNQMKNWAVLIVAAVVSAVVAMQKANPENQNTDLAIFIGAAIAYVFTLRFFVRAILCYINLVRWNNLQRSIVAYKLAHPPPESGAERKTAEQLKTDLLNQINTLYFKWYAPPKLSRRAQLLSNLKLGFGLLFALPILVGAVVALRVIPVSHLAMGVATFVVGYTLVEFIDFLTSPLFDTPEVAGRRKRPKSAFPTPETGSRYLQLSIANVVVSIAVGMWPEVLTFLRGAFTCH